MKMRGKVYGTYLHRVKYVGKGKKLKSPIAILHENNSNSKSVSMVKGQKNFSLDKKSQRIDVFNSNKQDEAINNVATENKDNLFSDFVDKTNDKKKKTNVLKVIVVTLAVVIVAGVVAVGTLLCSATNSGKKTAGNKESLENKDSTASLLLGSADNSTENTEGLNNTITNTNAPSEVKDNDSKTNVNNHENVSTSTNNNNSTASNKNNEATSNTNKNLVQANQGSSSNKVTTNQTSSTVVSSNTKKNVTITHYTGIAKMNSSCNVYHVTGTYVNAQSVKGYKYTKARVEKGYLFVPTSDLNGMWFTDDGSGVKVLAVYNNNRRIYVNTVYIHEREKKNYVYATKYFVLDNSWIEFDKEYSVNPNDKSGNNKFYIEYDTNLYSVS